MSRTDIHDFDTSDFYSYECLLTDDERAILPAVRKFTTNDVAPVLLENWSRATFPFEIVPANDSCPRWRAVTRSARSG